MNWIGKFEYFICMGYSVSRWIQRQIRLVHWPAAYVLSFLLHIITFILQFFFYLFFFNVCFVDFAIVNFVLTFTFFLRFWNKRSTRRKGYIWYFSNIRIYSSEPFGSMLSETSPLLYNEPCLIWSERFGFARSSWWASHEYKYLYITVVTTEANRVATQ